MWNFTSRKLDNFYHILHPLNMASHLIKVAMQCFKVPALWITSIILQNGILQKSHILLWIHHLNLVTILANYGTLLHHITSKHVQKWLITSITTDGQTTELKTLFHKYWNNEILTEPTESSVLVLCDRTLNISSFWPKQQDLGVLSLADGHTVI